MKPVQTTIAVYGFTPAEATKGIPDLRVELAQRALLKDVRWDPETSRLLVTVESASQGERTAKLRQDQVWDCVIACINFSGKNIRFEQLAD